MIYNVHFQMIRIGPSTYHPHKADQIHSNIFGPVARTHHFEPSALYLVAQ